MGRVMSVLLLVIAWRPSVVNELPVAAQPRIQFILKETVREQNITFSTQPGWGRADAEHPLLLLMFLSLPVVGVGLRRRRVEPECVPPVPAHLRS